MEQNTQIIAKKIWNLMSVAFYMLRKGICKRKILLDLNLMMKKGKIASKTLQKLMFNHHQHHHRHQNHQHQSSEAGIDAPLPHLQGEYEFSCSNTPFYQHYFSNKKKQNLALIRSFYTPYSSFEELYRTEGGCVDNVFDIEASPGLGLGLDDRQLRITDSPFSVHSCEDNNHVDAEAEDFIKKFYSQLKNQKCNE